MGKEPAYINFLSLPCWDPKHCVPTFDEGDYRGRTVSFLDKDIEYQTGAYFVGNLIVKDTHQVKHLLLLTDLYEAPFGSVPGEDCPMADQHLCLRDYSALMLDETALDHIVEATTNNEKERLRQLYLRMLPDLGGSGDVGNTLFNWFSVLLYEKDVDNCGAKGYDLLQF